MSGSYTSSSGQPYFPSASPPVSRSSISGSSSNGHGNANTSSKPSRRTSVDQSGSFGRSSRTSSTFLGSNETAAPPVTHMESTVTRLLVATKQLLEGLSRWSRQEVSDTDISDIFVKLGNDFNVACNAFGAEGISMSNLMHFPADLRACLEACLCEPPSPRALDLYLPKVRQIIVALLGGLKEKQVMYREGVSVRRERENNQRERAQQREKEVRDREQALLARGQSISGSGSNSPLTPITASRSRDDLQAFVTRAAGGNEPGDLSKRTSMSRNGSSSQRNQTQSSTLSQPTPTLPSSQPQRSNSNSASNSRPQSTSGERSTSNPARAPHPSSSSARTIDIFPSRRSVSADESNSGGAPNIPIPNLPSNPISNRSNSGPPSSSSSSTTTTPAFEEPSFSRAKSSNSSSPPTPIPSSAVSTTFTIPSPVSSTSRSSGLPAAPPLQPIPGSDLLKFELPSPFSPDSIVETFSSMEKEQHDAAQQESLDALKASDMLTRRASKRFSILAHRSITGGDGSARASPGSNGSSAAREVSYASGGGTPEASRSGTGRRKGELRAVRDGGETRTPPRMPPLPYSVNANSGSIPTSLSSSSIVSRAETILEEDDHDTSSGSISMPTFGRSRNVIPPYSGPETMGNLFNPAGSTRSSYASYASYASAESTAETTQTYTPVATPRGRVISNSSTALSDPDVVEFPLSIYLQIERNVKKVKLEEMPTIAKLRVLFIEKFQYNPGLDDFPAIYLRDSKVGVEYELEDLAEVKEGSLLSLNIDTVEQVKHHIDQGLSSLSQHIKELTTTVTAIQRASVLPSSSLLSPAPSSSTTIHSPPLPRPSERQFQDVAQKVYNATSPQSLGTSSFSPHPSPANATISLASLSSANSITPSSPSASTKAIVGVLKTQHEEVQNLRREVGILRQVHVDFVGQAKMLFADLRAQTSHVQSLAATKVSTSRAFIDAGKGKLESESTDLIVQGDEIQDVIDQMRADMSIKGVRPPGGTMIAIEKTLTEVNRTRDALVEWIATVKPSWKATWSDELQRIITEQQMLDAQEVMLGELHTDLQEAGDILMKMQKVAKDQPSSRKKGGGGRGKEFVIPVSNVEDHQGLSTVLMEVRGLQPDGNRRLEAIAESERRRELNNANRSDELTDELGAFVAGGKLKKSGGIEETERLRQARSESTLKKMFAS